MHQFKYLITLFALLSAFPLFGHATTIQNTKISFMMMDANYGHKLYIRTSVNHASGSPACFNSSWSFVLDMSTELGMSMYSTLLAVYMADKSLNLIGNDECNNHTGIEDLRRIEFY